MQAQQRQGRVLTGRILLLALAYVLAGRLALLLAIPPGFATAIFPPVGIALAAVLIWGYPLLFGVFLGSTLLNLSISADSLAQLDSGHFWVASGIALGTCLQCLTASWLIRRLLGFPNALVDERSIFMLLVLGGPLSCLLSASVGPGVLYQAGLIPGSALPFSFWTWWVGDSIGVLIATPLMFILFAEPRAIWRSRLTTVGLPLLLSCALMVAVFIRASEAEQSERQHQFQGQARLISMTLQFRLQLYSQAINPLKPLAKNRKVQEDFAVAVVRMSDVVNHSLDHYPRHEFQIQIDDVSTQQIRVLYSDVKGELPDYAKSMIWQEIFEFGGRQLRLQIVPSTWYLQQAHSLQPWLVLTGGLLICALLGGFLLTMTGRAELIRDQVRQRTLELSAILDNAAEAILIFASDGRIEIANPAAVALFGGSGSALVGRQIRELLPSVKLSQPAILQAMLGQSCERMGRHVDGHQMELELSLSHYELPDRQRYICLLRDISTRKQIERLKSEFVSTVSHELRTPLTSIKGSLGLLEAGVAGELPERGRSLIQMALQNADRLASLVDDILDIEKLEFGQAGIQLNRCELQPLLREAMEHSQGYADSYRVHLQLDTSGLPAGSAVMVDNLRLQQVIANLVSNAVKYSPRGGTVNIVATTDLGQARVRVIDRGPGIPEAFRPRIFHKFAQADSSDTRLQGGTGLGLNICKTLLERMNGQIGYETELGVGSTFHFDLPLAKGE